MAAQTALQMQQSLSTPALPGTWKLGAGRAVTLMPREDAVLRIAHGRLWVTFDGPHPGHGNELGDHFLGAGEQLVVQAGQRAVAESFGTDRNSPAYFSWDPVPALAPNPLRAVGSWQLAVVQPLADLRLALVLAAAAVGRLGLGLAGLATDLVAGRGRGTLAARAFNAQSSACRAH